MGLLRGALPWRHPAAGLWLVALLLGGCAVRAEPGRWEGPSAPAAVAVTKWTFGETEARLLSTARYRIYTTIADEEVLALLPQVMEGALTMYQRVAPVPLSDRPMECFIFRSRGEWDRYTQFYAGPDAKVYLQIRNGGYTIQDRYVAWYIGRVQTFSVSAHEGWHQFAGRHFVGRLPPFLEEGLACMFETVSWRDRLPQWNLSMNAPRAQSLRAAMDAQELYGLAQLCSMHAGDIVGQPHGKIDTFYAQCWSFARFLWEGEGGRYRPALQRLIADIAAGTVHDPTGSHRRAGAPWNRAAVRPMLEHYLGASLDAIEPSWRAFMRRIAYEELPGHWQGG